MIKISHLKGKVISVDGNSEVSEVYIGTSVVFTLQQLSKKFSDEIVIWYSQEVTSAVNFEQISTLLNLDRKLISYQPKGFYFSDRIGYVDQSPFINVNKDVTFPTWQMSSCVGAIYLNILLQIDEVFYKQNNFDFFLNEIAKHYQPLGLFCYSEPRLLKSEVSYKVKTASNYELFKFVKLHYKNVWSYLLLLNIFLYERRLPLFSFLKVQIIRKIKYKKRIDFHKSELTVIDKRQESIDVVIPTIGRKKYLYDVLCDLRNQTHMPVNVIIVEQNPLQDSVSELDYILTEDYPFKIKHVFTHQTGACNARNIALSMVESKWVFLADDDIKFDSDLIEKGVLFLITHKVFALIFNCLMPHEKKTYFDNSQTTIFGSGCSIYNFEKAKNIRFNLSYEFGFGEDTEFGMQLRNAGIDIIYFSDVEIKHLKAPIGGFRTKFTQPWESENIKPKPSPTIMCLKRKYNTIEQTKGYKTRLFLKLYSFKIWKVNEFLKKWDQSVYWSNKL